MHALYQTFCFGLPKLLSRALESTSPVIDIDISNDVNRDADYKQRLGFKNRLKRDYD